MIKYLKYNLFLLIIFLGGLTSAQENNFLNKLDTNRKAAKIQVIFNQLEDAISQGNVSMLSNYLSPQTYLSLTNGIRGYYSSNQAYYILEDFFKIYNVSSFRVNNLNSSDNTPYATGVYNYEYKGKRNSAKVYISLNKSGANWKITQITIN
ncbi:MAG: DUF4783 domain-containing protein [Ignavibacteriales bacterium]|nr:MAG: DUF4783 domain-containing protein [Ignavibacteriales bacterium]